MESGAQCTQCGHALDGQSQFCGRCGSPSGRVRREGDEPTFASVRMDELLEGKWRLERKLGEGGMGSVFLAHDVQLDRKVAIKLLSRAYADDTELVARFEREARLTANLEHPHIVPVYAVGKHEMRPFIVMKSVEGQTLSGLLREKGALTLEETLDLMGQLCAGLEFIHARGFIHRDIKTGNIMVGSDGHATILDFGILRSSRGDEALTRTGVVMGTPHYMSPEQALGVREFDHRVDLYALAVVLFECLTGSLPFDGDSDLSVVQMQAHAAPPDLRERAPWIPPSVAGVVTKALAKRPEERFQSAAELFLALESAALGTPLPLVHAVVGSAAAPNAPMLSPRRRSHPSIPVPPLSEGPLSSLAHTSVPAEPPAAGVRRGRPPWVAGLIALGVLGLLVAGGVYTLREVRAAQAPTAPVPAAVAPPLPPAPAPVPVPEPVEVTPTDGLSDEGEKKDQAEEPAPAPPVVPKRASPARAVRDPAPTRPGRLNVVTTYRGEPYWAQVLVNGARKGTTPLLMELPVGRHSVRLERAGFKPVERQIKIAPGRAAILRIELSP